MIDLDDDMIETMLIRHLSTILDFNSFNIFLEEAEKGDLIMAAGKAVLNDATTDFLLTGLTCECEEDVEEDVNPEAPDVRLPTIKTTITINSNLYEFDIGQVLYYEEIAELLNQKEPIITVTMPDGSYEMLDSGEYVIVSPTMYIDSSDITSTDKQ